MRGKIALLISFLVILSFFSACTTSELLVNDSEVYVCTQKPVIIDPVAQNTINMLYENYLADCKANCPTCNCEVDAKIALLITDLNSSWSPGDLGRKVILPYGFGIDRCSSSPQNPFNADLGFDLKKCPEFQEFFFNPFTYPFVMFLESYYLEYINVLGVPLEGCTPTSYNQYYLPANSKCQLKESYVLVITTTNPNPIYVNEHMLVPFDVGSGRYMSVVYF
ncbi:MAG: hypothetical protein GYA51_07550, partial [Candidatus Methanofastidiosa archaeon]|nr:hypothetical protein [Candidatus Methanofastidiosa archaeon]